MKSTDFKSIGAPIKLRLEFDETTVGELSNILRQWQVLLRTAWRESYEINYRVSPPNPRILVSSASTENSFEIITDISLPLTVVGGILGSDTDWVDVARTAYRYLASIWSEKKDDDYAEASDHVYIRGGKDPELIASPDALRDNETGERIERLWKTANSGGINLTIEEPDDEDEDALPN